MELDIPGSAGETAALPNDAAPADVSANESSAAPAAPSDPLEKLTNFFASSEQVDNSDGEGQSDSETETTDDAASEETPAEQPPADPNAEQAEESAEDAADFDSLTRQTEFLDEAGLKAKFPRNSSKELIAQAAQYSAIARDASDMVQRIGGEHFVQPVENIVSGLKEGKAQNVFQGIIEASGTDSLLNVVGDAIALAMLNADGFSKSEDPYTSQFGTALGSLADKILTTKFGENATVERLSRLSQLADAGWLEAIDKWTTEDFIDRDEAQKLLAATNDPKLREANLENARLKKELDARSARDREGQERQQSEFDTAFSKSVAEQIGTGLNSKVWTNSPLKDQEKDTPEMKSEKAFLRERLLEDAIAAFDKSPTKQALIQAYRQGKQGTASFKTDLTNAVTEAILGIKVQTATAERMLAKLYGKGRNAQLASKRPTNSQPGNLQPTQPTTPDAPAGTKKTGDQIQTEMAERIAALG